MVEVVSLQAIEHFLQHIKPRCSAVKFLVLRRKKHHCKSNPVVTGPVSSKNTRDCEAHDATVSDLQENSSPREFQLDIDTPS